MISLRSLLSAAVLLSAIYACKPTQKSNSTSTTNNAVLETIGGKPVYVSEFNYVYNKNNTDKDTNRAASIKEYLELFTNFRLKVREAEALGLDSSKSFINELEGYKKQLAQPYLTEKGATDILSKEAYERMKEEINASHILITVAPDASAADSMTAYNTILDLRNKAVAGANFETLAAEYSQDPSAKSNKGNLNYFSALQMVYPFENAAYNTKVGEVSPIFRTRFGYHILKVNDRRKSQGEVLTAHIMVRATEGMSVEDSIAAKQKVDEIYSRLQKGEDWNKLCEQFSEDAMSKSKGGELPWFTTGRMIPSFENAAFALKDKSQYSKPIYTPYGWHIVKLLERKNLEPYAELESSIKSKVSKDSRSELNKSMLIKRLKKDNVFVEFPANLSKATALADSSILLGVWTKTVDANSNATLFTIANSKYTVNDFFKYITSKNRSSRESKNMSPVQYMKTSYTSYVEESLVTYEEDHLENKYEDYRMLVKEYRDGILLFQLMDEKVWSKAIEDTSGLKTYFDKNVNNYQWSTRAHAKVYSLASVELLDSLKAQIKKGKFAINTVILAHSYFQENKSALDETAKKAADEVIARLKGDRNTIVNLTAKVDSKEAANNAAIAKARLKSVMDYLKSKGIDSSRITTSAVQKPVFKKNVKPLSSDRIVAYQLYSTSTKALEAIFNESAPLTLQVTEGVFQKNDNDILKSMEWKKGESITTKDGRTYYVVIDKIESPRAKTLDEAKGLVISDYQTYLEKEWLKALKSKYPVVVNQVEVDKLINSKSK